MPGVPSDALLASIFCIPPTSQPIVNITADLPGPGAASLPITVTLQE